MFSDERTSAPGPGWAQDTTAGETLARALGGDPEALGEVLHRNQERVRRIVSIRLAVRLAQVLEAGPPAETWRMALRDLRGAEPTSEADLLRALAELVEGEVLRRPEAVAGEGVSTRRTLLLEGALDHERIRREDLERVVDARVAGLEREEQREVLLLRDYCGAGWELVRARLGLLSREAAQALYRRAHECLARRLRPHLRADGHGK